MKSYAIAVVGMAGTGKSEAIAYLVEALQIESIYFGGIVIEEVQKRGLEINATNEQIVRQELRAQEGMDVMARRSLPRIQQSIRQGVPICLDGLYSYAEYQTLKKELGERLVIIAIHADRSVREARLANRPIRPLSAAEVIERDTKEIEHIQKAPPIVLADYHMVNNKSLEDLHTKIDLVCANIFE